MKAGIAAAVLIFAALLQRVDTAIARDWTHSKLHTLLVQPGDLPAGFSAAQLRDKPPAMFDKLPASSFRLYQQLEYKGGTGGGVTLFMYDSKQDRERAYSLLSEGMEHPPGREGIGEKACGVAAKLSAIIVSTDLLFTRCLAVVHVRFSTDDLPSADAYAKRLDRRLQPVVCKSSNQLRKKSLSNGKP